MATRAGVPGCPHLPIDTGWSNPNTLPYTTRLGDQIRTSKLRRMEWVKLCLHKLVATSRKRLGDHLNSIAPTYLAAVPLLGHGRVAKVDDDSC